MKKSLFSYAAGMLILMACNQTKDAATTGTEQDSKKVAESYAANSREVHRAIETGDVSKLDAFIAKDIVDHEGNMGKDIVGLDSLKRYLGEIHQYFDGLKIAVITEGTSQDGNYHFSMVRMTGKAKENPWGMPVGMDMDDTSVDVVKIKDGKASEHWSFTSQKDMMEMMNAMSGGSQQTAQKEKTAQ